MTNRETFIKEIEAANITLSEEAAAYFETLKAKKEAPEITESGMKILSFLKDNEGNKFTSAEIGDEIGSTGRSVSGSMRKLVASGFVEKTAGEGRNPAAYSITAEGIEKV